MLLLFVVLLMFVVLLLFAVLLLFVVPAVAAVDDIAHSLVPTAVLVPLTTLWRASGGHPMLCVGVHEGR